MMTTFKESTVLLITKLVMFVKANSLYELIQCHALSAF
jgi:hypothetical protein